MKCFEQIIRAKRCLCLPSVPQCDGKYSQLQLLGLLLLCQLFLSLLYQRLLLSLHIIKSHQTWFTRNRKKWLEYQKVYDSYKPHSTAKSYHDPTCCSPNVYNNINIILFNICKKCFEWTWRLEKCYMSPRMSPITIYAWFSIVPW